MLELLIWAALVCTVAYVVGWVGATREARARQRAADYARNRARIERAWNRLGHEVNIAELERNRGRRESEWGAQP